MLQVNPAQLIIMIKNGQNPQQLMLNILESQMSSSPIGNNLIQLAKQNNAAGIEQVVRNLVSQQGFDFDKEFANFKKSLFF